MTRLYEFSSDIPFEETWAYRVATSIKSNFQQRLELGGDGKWVAPFQFSLCMCAAMYRDLLGEDFDVRKGSYKESESSSMAFSRILEGDPPRLNFPDPFYPKRAKSTSIRAVEFLTWEEATRVFLARRIYPIYFDFLSYSSCHEGWGAVGHMLTQLQMDPKDRKIASPPFYEEKFSQRALPFLKESKRLGFSSIFTFPVLKPGRNSDQSVKSSEVWGAYVVFLDEASSQPESVLGSTSTEFSRFQTYLIQMSQLTAEILEIQSHMLELNTDQTYRLAWESWLNESGITVFKIDTEIEVKSTTLENFPSRILSQLALAEQFVVEDKSSYLVEEINNGETRKLNCTFLLAPSEETLKGNSNDRIAYCKAKVSEAIFRELGSIEGYKLNISVSRLEN